MGAIRIASVAFVGAAALGLAPSTAVAADGSANASSATPTFTVTPSVIAPAGQVTLNATGCSGDATASSGVFDTVTIPRNSSRNATVDGDAKRGASYTVTFNCDGVRSTTQLTIAGGAPTASSTTRPTFRPTDRPTIRSSTPPLGVRGGLGGSVHDGLDPVELTVGATLVAVALGGGVYALRRRSAARRH